MFYYRLKFFKDQNFIVVIKPKEVGGGMRGMREPARNLFELLPVILELVNYSQSHNIGFVRIFFFFPFFFFFDIASRTFFPKHFA